MKLVSPSNCCSTPSSVCYLFKHNRFQLKVGTFAQNKSSSTMLVENLLDKWQYSSKSAIVVVTLCDDVMSYKKEVKYSSFKDA